MTPEHNFSWKDPVDPDLSLHGASKFTTRDEGLLDRSSKHQGTYTSDENGLKRDGSHHRLQFQSPPQTKINQISIRHILSFHWLLSMHYFFYYNSQLLRLNDKEVMMLKSD